MQIEQISTDAQLQTIIQLDLYPPVDIIYVKIPDITADIPLDLGTGTYQENYKYGEKNGEYFIYLGRDLDGNQNYPMTKSGFDLWVSNFNLEQFSLGLELTTEEI